MIALIQSILAGIGLFVAGIPASGLLTAVMFILAIAQVGVVPVMLVAVGWLFYQKITVWAITLLILGGVIGGLIALGVIGLFVGPVVLAVCYELVKAWVNDGEEQQEKATE